MNPKNQYAQNKNEVKSQHEDEASKLHDYVQKIVISICKIVAVEPSMPNANSLKKAADCIGKLTHALFDYRQHNAVLFEENCELYRQLELRQSECDAYLDDINNLQSELQHWRDYYAENSDLFTPNPALVNGSRNQASDEN
jgi:hypothetical protein